MAHENLEVTLNPPALPEVLERPPRAGKVLVMAPHADDETLGLGGTILLHGEQRDPVDVLFLTVGITGNSDGRYEEQEYIRRRQEEGRAACDLLGVRQTFFWEYPDNYEVTENDLAVIVPRLCELLERGGYDVVYTPHRGEIHSDHHASAVMAARAVRRMEKPPALYAYEVWSAMRPEYVVDISRLYPKKLKAAKCYETQLALNDITRLFTCLNGYRSAFLKNKQGYGEALLRMGKR
jgi:LmbE family N-acetylglucosaminyl deacetylase